MNSIILVVIFVCGLPDTIIVKHPNKHAVATHSVTSPRIVKDYYEILKKKHILIQYEEDRGTCA